MNLIMYTFQGIVSSGIVGRYPRFIAESRVVFIHGEKDVKSGPKRGAAIVQLPSNEIVLGCCCWVIRGWISDSLDVLIELGGR